LTRHGKQHSRDDPGAVEERCGRGEMLNPDGPVWPHLVRSYRRNALEELATKVPLVPAQWGSFAAAQGAA
jgi:hypothetical protein